MTEACCGATWSRSGCTPDLSPVAAEQAMLGFDHTKIALRMAKRWKFPAVVQAGIRYHHNSHEYDGDGAMIVRCVDVANFLCTIKGVTSIGMRLVAPPHEALKALNLSRDDLGMCAS